MESVLLDANVARKKKFFKICICGKEFNVCSTYYKHKKKCNGEPPTHESRNFLCKEENCTFNSHLSSLLIEHLRNYHNLYVPQEEIKVFEKYEEFKIWKENFEKETKAFFTHGGFNKTTRKKNAYFYCNRSGIYISQATGKRTPKSQGPRKMGFNCTASIKVKIEENSEKVNATIFPFHYGHVNELSHVPIPKSDREAIASQLAQGMQHHRILRNLYDGQIETFERKHLCTKKDLHNISKAYRIDKIEKHTEDHSEDMCVEENVNEEINLNPDCRSDLETLKKNLLQKLMEIDEKIKNCNDRNLLIKVKDYINNASNALDLPFNLTDIDYIKLTRSLTQSVQKRRFKNATKKKRNKKKYNKYAKSTLYENSDFEDQTLIESN